MEADINGTLKSLCHEVRAEIEGGNEMPNPSQLTNPRCCGMELRCSGRSIPSYQTL